MTVLTTLCAGRVLVEAFLAVPLEEGTNGSTGTGIAVAELHRLWIAILSEKLTFLFGSFTLLCAWSLTSLLCFHGMIISIAQTTNERVRGVYRFGQVENDADRGCCRNWYDAACLPCPVSRLPRDMSESAVCHYTEPETVWTGDNQDDQSGVGGGIAAASGGGNNNINTRSDGGGAPSSPGTAEGGKDAAPSSPGYCGGRAEKKIREEEDEDDDAQLDVEATADNV
jgi:hypothetical protein